MATAFPFNKISKIPLKVLTILLPIITAQQTLAKKLASRLEEELDNLSKNAKCNDAQVLALKQKLDALQKTIDNIQQILGFIPPITKSLRIVNTTATIVSTVQLAIPAAPGVPQGPIMQTLNAAVETISNVTAVITTLANVANNVLQIANRLESVIQKAEDKLKSLCATQPPAAVSSNVADLADLYPSEFYQLVNVSQEDIDNRFAEIQQLLDQQLDVISNLNEAPSQIIIGEGQPQSDIGQAGDYYVDSETENVFGPKPNDTSWI
jgi:hypothetical protein